MNEIQTKFVADTIALNSVEFYSKIDNLFKFKKFNDRKLRMDYVYYIEETCTVCAKPYFKRRSNKKTKAHIKCANGVRK